MVWGLLADALEMDVFVDDVGRVKVRQPGKIRADCAFAAKLFRSRTLQLYAFVGLVDDGASH